jgi:hypothetical protein
MDAAAQHALNAFVGTWLTEATHPVFPDPVQGRTVFEWLAGEQFLLQRSTNDHADLPDGLSVIGGEADRLTMHYFDSRGVERIYEGSMGDGKLKLWRDEPGFSQRFTGTFEDGGRSIDGRWQLAREPDEWADDLLIRYRRKS